MQLSPNTATKQAIRPSRLLVCQECGKQDYSHAPIFRLWDVGVTINGTVVTVVGYCNDCVYRWCKENKMQVDDFLNYRQTRDHHLELCEKHSRPEIVDLAHKYSIGYTIKAKLITNSPDLPSIVFKKLAKLYEDWFLAVTGVKYEPKKKGNAGDFLKM